MYLQNVKKVFTPLGHYAHFVMKHVKNLKFDRNLVLRFVQKLMPNILLQKAHEKMISLKSYITNTITKIKKVQKKFVHLSKN